MDLAPTVLIGLITGSMALAGVLYTQRQALRREDLTWHRQLAHETEVWRREDLARTFEQRRDAYLEFYEALKFSARLAADAELPTGPSLEGVDWHFPTYLKLQRLEVFGTQAVIDPATEAYRALFHWGHYLERMAEGTYPETRDELGIVTDELIDRLAAAYNEIEPKVLTAIRTDLALQVTV